IGGAVARHAASGAIVFACRAGVRAVLSRTTLTHRVIAIGEEAENALREEGLTPSLIIEGACEDALRKHASALREGPLLLVVAEQGRPNLEAELVGLGASVEILPAYQYVREMPELKTPIDLIVLPSSSAARAVLAGDAASALLDVPMIA